MQNNEYKILNIEWRVSLRRHKHSWVDNTEMYLKVRHKMWNTFMWYGMGFSGRIPRTWQLTLRFNKRWGISSVPG